MNHESTLRESYLSMNTQKSEFNYPGQATLETGTLLDSDLVMQDDGRSPPDAHYGHGRLRWDEV